jgi:hypothetical protein
MTEENNNNNNNINIESNTETQEPVKKETRGRKKIPDELKKPKKEKPKKEKRVKPDKEVERVPRKKGRPVGTITKPERYKPDGKYDKKPNDPEWSKKYYDQYASQILTCEICGIACVRHNFVRHQRSMFCKTTREQQQMTLNDQSA